MCSVYDVPAEVWILAFEYLNLEDLVHVSSACETLWKSITHQVASSVIGSIISHSIPDPEASVDGPSLKSQELIQRRINGLKLNFLYFSPCCLDLRMRQYSHVFQRSANSTSLVVRLDSPSPFPSNPKSLFLPREFHPHEHGPAPAEIVLFWADFKSVNLPPDLCGTLHLSYTTAGMSIFDHIDDGPMDGNGCFSRTISHQLRLYKLEWHTLDMLDGEFEELPKEWAGILQDHVDVMMRFEKSWDLTHRKRTECRGQDEDLCTPFALKDFKATWTFVSVPLSIAQVANDNSEGDHNLASDTSAAQA